MNEKDLIRRGWSAKKVKKWLGDKKEYSTEDVLAVEATEKFKNFLKRKNKKNATTIPEKIKCILSGKTTFKEIEKEELIRKALTVAYSLSFDKKPEAAIKRECNNIIQNYIRHELANGYDEVMHALNGNCDRDIIYNTYRTNVDREIRTVYPWIYDNSEASLIYKIIEEIGENANY